MRKQRQCKRCGHIWIPSNKKRPKKCPWCKSRFWDESWITQMLSGSKKELKV